MTLSGRLIYSFELELAVGLDLGHTPTGERRVFDFLGGTIHGLVNGKSGPVPTGSLWIETPDRGWLYARWSSWTMGTFGLPSLGGRIVLPDDVRAMTRPERVALDPTRYYFRVAPLYDTDSPRYSWLNGIQAVGVCRFVETGIAGEVYEVL